LTRNRTGNENLQFRRAAIQHLLYLAFPLNCLLYLAFGIRHTE